MQAGLPIVDITAALRLAASSPRRWMDAASLMAGCLSSSSREDSARVTVETDPKLKERLGGLAYAITGIAHFAELSDNHGRFHAEGFSWEGRFLAMAIGNGRQAGGGIQLCPNALIDDGLLDLTILPAPSCPQWITRRAWMPLGICCAKAREAFGPNWLRREARGSRMNRSATST